MRLFTNLEALDQIVCEVNKDIKACIEVSDTLLRDIRLIISELVANAIKHGNRYDEKKKIHVEFEVNSECFKFTISDEGEGFSMKDIANPLSPENLYSETGRGLFIVSSLVDTIEQEGSRVAIVKKWKKG